MLTIIRTASITVLALLATASSNANAASFQINGIAPFDTNLGTLTHVVVSLDPSPVQTTSYETTFNSISTHLHHVFAPAANISGLGSFSFAQVATSYEGSNSFSSHSHNVNIFASVNNYAGAGLNWFLNPANLPVNSVLMPTFPTTNNENHSHNIHLFPIVPRTTYTYTPIPEPTTFALLAIAGLAAISGRRQIA